MGNRSFCRRFVHTSRGTTVLLLNPHLGDEVLLRVGRVPRPQRAVVHELEPHRREQRTPLLLATEDAVWVVPHVALSACHVVRDSHVLCDEHEATGPGDARRLLQQLEGAGGSVVQHVAEERDVARIILLGDVLPVEEADGRLGAVLFHREDVTLGHHDVVGVRSHLEGLDDIRGHRAIGGPDVAEPGGGVRVLLHLLEEADVHEVAPHELGRGEALGRHPTLEHVSGTVKLDGGIWEDRIERPKIVCVHAVLQPLRQLPDTARAATLVLIEGAAAVGEREACVLAIDVELQQPVLAGVARPEPWISPRGSDRIAHGVVHLLLVAAVCYGTLCPGVAHLLAKDLLVCHAGFLEPVGLHLWRYDLIRVRVGAQDRPVAHVDLVAHVRKVVEDQRVVRLVPIQAVQKVGRVVHVVDRCVTPPEKAVEPARRLVPVPRHLTRQVDANGGARGVGDVPLRRPHRLADGRQDFAEDASAKPAREVGS
mmetsp:Transcript_40974/g.98350  ORF Transcript_40974/g.98350 Transcript_40974/m.98350 type:complete len:482 (-) Transcript_40974:1388-2833(-)